LQQALGFTEEEVDGLICPETLAAVDSSMLGPS
jgi:lysozyme family protein